MIDSQAREHLFTASNLHDAGTSRVRIEAGRDLNKHRHGYNKLITTDVQACGCHGKA
jgi:hypothetical protein